MNYNIKWNDYAISSIRYSQDFWHVYATLHLVDGTKEYCAAYEIEFCYCSIEIIEWRGDEFLLPIKEFVVQKLPNGNYDVVINLCSDLGVQVKLSCSEYHVYEKKDRDSE